MAFAGDSIYWVEVNKVVPNPFQPRREFDEAKLAELGESIRMYGVLQPLTVTRKEVQREDGTFFTEYELIAGERRLRASRLAGVAQVPVIIREGEDSEQEKLELAIIENLQREDLNAIDRALAFQQLAEQFRLTHAQVAQKVGRSREYVANSIRLLALPEHMRSAVQRGELGEGHARTLLMLKDKPEELEVLFKEALLKKLSVRELERIARKIATDKVRKIKKNDIDPHLIELEREFTQTLGTRVEIMPTEFGGRLTIDYFSEDDLAQLLQKVREEQHSAHAQPTSTSASAPAQHEVVNRLASATPLAAAPVAVPEASPVLPAPPVPSSVPQYQTAAPAAPAPAYTPTPPIPPAPSIAPPVASVSEAVPTPTPALSPSQYNPAPAEVPVADPFPASEAVPEPLASQYNSVPSAVAPIPPAAPTPVPPPATEPKDDDDTDLYSLKSFTV